MHTSFSHGASLSQKRLRQDRRASGVSAAVREWLNLVCPRSPTRSPYPPSGPGRTGGTQVYPPLCGSGCALYIPRSPTGRPYPQSGPGRTGGTRVYPPLCGGGFALCIPRSPTGRPYPQSDPGRTAGTRVHAPSFFGSGWPMHTSFSHGASLSPKRSRQVRRDSGASASVWGGCGLCIPRSPTGRSYPQNGPSRTGGTRVHAPPFWEWLAHAYLVLPRGVPIPQSV